MDEERVRVTTGAVEVERTDYDKCRWWVTDVCKSRRVEGSKEDYRSVSPLLLTLSSVNHLSIVHDSY